MLNAPGIKRLKLKYYKLLPIFAINFNFRHYTEEEAANLELRLGRAVQVAPILTLG